MLPPALQASTGPCISFKGECDTIMTQYIPLPNESINEHDISGMDLIGKVFLVV